LRSTADLFLKLWGSQEQKEIVTEFIGKRKLEWQIFNYDGQLPINYPTELSLRKDKNAKSGTV
jgi:hypothetical protein